MQDLTVENEERYRKFIALYLKSNLLYLVEIREEIHYKSILFFDQHFSQ